MNKTYERKLFNLLNLIKDSMKDVSADLWNLLNSLGGSYRENIRLSKYQDAILDDIVLATSRLEESIDAFQPEKKLGDKLAANQLIIEIDCIDAAIKAYFTRFATYKPEIASLIRPLYKDYTKQYNEFASKTAAYNPK